MTNEGVKMRSKINLNHGDCMEAMASMADNAYDLAIVDVQYGIGEDGRKNDTRCKLAVAKTYKVYSSTDNKPPPAEYFKELMRVSKNQIIWGANHFIEQFCKNSSCWIVWDKENGKTDYADCELAWTSFGTAVRKYAFKWQGMLQGDMKNKQIRIHPNEKPIVLYKWLLKNYAKEGDKILDTHGGSGSSVVACIDMGFSIDWLEQDKKYFELAVARTERHVAQLDFLRPEFDLNIEQ